MDMSPTLLEEGRGVEELQHWEALCCGVSANGVEQMPPDFSGVHSLLCSVGDWQQKEPLRQSSRTVHPVPSQGKPKATLNFVSTFIIHASDDS
jgi:hypothetical protein